MTSTKRTAYNQHIRDLQRDRGVRRVNVTLDPEELARFQALADSRQKKVTTVLKECALAHLDTKYLVPPDIQERLDELLAIMRGVGNNLNQLAQYSNEMRYFLDTAEVRLQLRRMDDEVRRFVEMPMRVNEEDRP